jgi:hypothetical protein
MKTEGGSIGNGLNIQEILKSVGGDNLSGIGTKLGLDKDGDGDVDLNDVTRMFKF